METDQIQKALYIKSDAQTKEGVAAATKTVRQWQREHVACIVRVPVGLGRLISRDGKLLTSPAMFPEDDVQALRNRLPHARVEISLNFLLDAAEEAMFDYTQPGDRVAYIKQFLADVEKFEEAARELTARVQSLEDDRS